MKLKILGGVLPPELEELLGAAIEDEAKKPKFTAASKEQLAALLEAAAQPKLQVGDILVLREHAKHQFKWPQADERVIVTQVLAVPYRSGSHGSSESAQPADVAIGMACAEGHVHEFLHDSRNFVKVGSIFQ